MNNVEIEESKLLGVPLDCKLAWSKHIDATEAKMGRGLFVIKCRSAFLTSLSTRQAIQALVLSHLDYCPLMWTSATKRNIGTLQLAQNRAAWPLDVHGEPALIICMSISEGSSKEEGEDHPQ